MVFKKLVVSARGEKFIIRFGYDTQLVSAVKNIPDARFNWETKVWSAPFRSYPEVLKFIETYNATLDASQDTVRKLAELYSDYQGGKPRPVVKRQTGKNKNLLAITFPYHPDLQIATASLPCAHKAKTVADGHHWVVPKSGAWEILEYIDTYNCVCEQSLIDELRLIAEQATVLYDASWRVEPSSEVPFYANDDRAPYVYQKAAVEYLINTKKCILGDAVGTGKSSITISALGSVDAFPALIVVPKSAKFVWDEYELPVWMPQKTRQVLYGQKADADIDADIVITNYDILWHWKDKLIEYGFKTFIADESHALANPSAKRTSAAVEICNSNVEYTWLLTGTPITNRPTELIGQLQVLGRLSELFVSPSVFTNRYEPERNVSANLKELATIMRSNCFIRRDRKKLFPPIPVVRSFLPIEISAEHRKEYKAAKDDIVAYMVEVAKEKAESLGLDPRSAAVTAAIKAEAGKHIIKLSKLRQIAGKAKVAGTIDFIESYLEQFPEEKVLIFGYHRENLDAYRDHFDCKIIRGGVSDKDRSEAIMSIQEGDDRVVCLQIRAAGEALTLTAAGTCIFTEQDWSPMRLVQAEARSARLGQTSEKVRSFYTVAEDTIDYKLFSVLQSKFETCLSFMDRADSDDLVYINDETSRELLEVLLNG